MCSNIEGKSFIDNSKIETSEMVKFAKALAKKNKKNWIEVYTEMVMWAMVNMINKDNDFWIELKETYVGEDFE